MIAPPSGVRVLMATKPVDFRKGANGLAALIKDEMKADPFSGVVYVFRAKRADRVKLLYWDGTGVVLTAKTLEQGGFRWPKLQDGAMRLTATQLSALLDGLDWHGSTALDGHAHLSRRTDSQRPRGRLKALRTWSTPGRDRPGGRASERRGDAQGDAPGGARPGRAAGPDHQGAAAPSLRPAGGDAPPRPARARP